jgi:hypothetical protein
VILDPAERAAGIQAQVAAAGGDITGDSRDLLLEWADLVEYPTVVIGTIPREFADLPDEVLETVLAHHQKAVTLPRSSDGSPRFAAISGGDNAAAANVAQGQERVVVARLKDARFFYEEDRKRTLESRVDDLAAVTFHKGLGSYRDKSESDCRSVEKLALQAGRAAGVAAPRFGSARALLRQGRPRHLDGARVPRVARDHGRALLRGYREARSRGGHPLALSPVSDRGRSGSLPVTWSVRRPANVRDRSRWLDKLDTLVGYSWRRNGAIGQ